MGGTGAVWRSAFIAVVALGVVAFVSTLVFVRPGGSTGAGGLAAQARHALAPRVLAVLGVGFFLMGGQFAALTYLAPFLGTVTGVSGPLVSIFPLAYGAATVTLVACNAVLVLALAALYVVGSAPIPVALALGVWGLVGSRRCRRPRWTPASRSGR